MWGNINTSMFETYAHLTDDDIDNEVFMREGIIDKKDTKQSEMSARQCVNCYAINPPTHNFCSLCGKPLNGDTQKSMIRLTKEIEETPEYQCLLDIMRQKSQNFNSFLF